jgi:hypothetical protein
MMIQQTAAELLNGERQQTLSFLKYKTMVIGFIVFGLLVALASASAIAAEPVDSGSKLTVHGFLSQAYANSNGGQIIGIPTTGTSRYRNVALQFRYDYSLQDAFLIQLNNNELGESPLTEEHSDLQLNWIFYQRQFLDGTMIKVGKFPTPIGIYNEVLHVGTVLPFYRLPYMFYGDGAFTSETIDGVGLYQKVSMGESWDLEADLYAGEWDFVQQQFGIIVSTRSKDILGAQLWLQTPMEGLRFGLGGNRSTDSNLLPPHGPDDKQTHKNWYVSLDGNFERFLFQAEYRKSVTVDQKYHSYYVLAGVKLYEKLGLNVQAEFAELTIPNFISNVKLSRDYAVGLRYAFRPDLVLKLEEHWLKTYVTDDPVVPLTSDPIDVDYYIISLSASF